MEIPIINVNKSQIGNLLKQAISGAIQPFQRYIIISSDKKETPKKTTKSANTQKEADKTATEKKKVTKKSTKTKTHNLV